MTVPTLILIGELDDWTLAEECRNMVDGRDDWGISRQKGQGVPIKLVVYPGAYHGFDAPTPRDARSSCWAITSNSTSPQTTRSIEALQRFPRCDNRRGRQQKSP